MPKFLALFALALSLAAAASNDWEAVRGLPAGRPVEVRYAKKYLTGELVSATADQMVIKTKAGDVTAARVDVRKVWVPANRRGRNAAIGAAIGVAAGLAPGLFLQRYANNEIGGGGTYLASTLAITGGIGAGMGALSSGRDLIYKRP